MDPGKTRDQPEYLSSKTSLHYAQNLGINVFKIIILGGILSDIRSEIKFDDDTLVEL